MSGAYELAGRGARLGATMLDLILVFCFGLLLMMVTGTLEDAADYSGIKPVFTIGLLGISSYLMLNSWLLLRRGQTIGKRLVNIVVVNRPVISDTDDSTDDLVKAPFWKLLLRSVFFFVIYIFPMSWILILIDHLLIFGKQRRCLHDLVLWTSVVRLQPA